MFTPRRTLSVIALIAIVTIGVVSLGTADGTQPKSIKDIITSYVQDFRSDRFAEEARLFGITVPDHGEWHIRITGEKAGDNWTVELNDGPPPVPTFIYRVDADTLRAIDAGELNGLTAQGKAFASDFAPMDAINMEGFEPTFSEEAAINAFSFHFWTRGFPEIVPFGEGMTRRAHGS
ncbi:MAG: hypothetical protein AAF432_14660, partial [Planctomycetota bacterium]